MAAVGRLGRVSLRFPWSRLGPVTGLDHSGVRNLSFTVAGYPPAKNEATSMFNWGDGCCLLLVRQPKVVSRAML